MSKNLQIITPKGELEWIIISGDGKPNFAGDGMIYTADVVLEDVSAKELKTKLLAFWTENKPTGAKKAKSMGYKPHSVKTEETYQEDVLDDDGEIEHAKGDPVYKLTGKTVFTFKTNVKFKSGDNKTIKIYNAKNNEIHLGKKKIGNGSRGKVAGSAGIYANKNSSGVLTAAGVTLYLDGIKLMHLEEYSGGVNFDEDTVDEADEDNFEGISEVDKLEEVTASEETTGKDSAEVKKVRLD